MGPSPSPSGSQWGLPLLADGPLLPPPHELRRARLIRNLRATAPIVLTAAVAGGVAVTVVERKRRRERLATGGHWHSVTQVRRHNATRDRAGRAERADLKQQHQVPIRKAGEIAKGKQPRQPAAAPHEAPPPAPAVPSAPDTRSERDGRRGATRGQGLSETAVDLLCGAAAEATQLATLYPIDTLKVRCQLSRASPRAELRSIWAGGAGRIRGLYAGCLPAALGASLFGGLYMLAYQSFYRRNLRLMGADPDRALAPAGAGSGGHNTGSGCHAVAEEEDEWQGPPLAALSMAAALSAMMANCCTAVVEVPLDTARQRLQAGVANGSLVTVMRTAATAGPRVLYAGFVPFLLRTIPLDALQFCVYEALQSVRERTEASASAAADARGESSPPPVLSEAVTDMLLGGIAGGVSAFLTMPLDCIKTHINCGPQKGGLSVVSAARMIWTASGPRGFFAGTSSRLLERVPSCAVYWLAAEATRRVLSPEEGGTAGAAA